MSDEGRPAGRREYVRVPVGLASDPRLHTLGDPVDVAMAICALLTSMIDAMVTDGHVTLQLLQRKTGAPDTIVKSLITEGLWHEPGHDCRRCPPVREGFIYVHDHVLHQGSAEKRAKVAANRAAAGKLNAEKRWQAESDRKAARREKAEQKSQIRPDVEELCEHLATQIKKSFPNMRKPAVTDTWRHSMRQLLDTSPKKKPDAVRAAIDWAHQHPFWFKNIRSPLKLRKHYETMQADAAAERKDPGHRARSFPRAGAPKVAPGHQVNLLDHAAANEAALRAMGIGGGE